MSKYTIAVSKPDGSVTKEIVEATNALHALEVSKLASQPFNNSIQSQTNVQVTVTNEENSAEKLTMEYKFTE